MHALLAVIAFAMNSAWIPPWDGNALTSIQMNAGALQESNPVWYSWNADGTIAKNWNAENDAWRAAMTGTRLMPTIQNVIAGSFSAIAVQTMLATADARDAHASAIAQLAAVNAFDGIDVDYERIPAAARANFTAFVTSLAQKLHAAGKKLSVTVYAKTSDVTWNGAGAEDWTAIGAAADEVKIMAYDYHESSTGPGDITPLPWLDQVATYAESVIPSKKIVIGLPWYGYDWGSSSTRSVTWASAMTTAQTMGATVTHDASGEATFSYADHVVYFQDAAAYAKKIELLTQKHSGIAGIANWLAGAEDPAIWPMVKGGAGAAPPPSDFFVSGPSELSVRQGSETTGEFRLVPVNGFTGTASVSLIRGAGFAGEVASDVQALTAASPVRVHITVSTSVPTGVYEVVVRFTSGSLIREQTVQVVVNAAAVRRRIAAH